MVPAAMVRAATANSMRPRGRRSIDRLGVSGALGCAGTALALAFAAMAALSRQP